MSAQADLERLATMAAGASAVLADNAADAALADWLYRDWYLTPPDGFEPEAAPPPFDSLSSALSAVVDHAVPWSDDWIAQSVLPGGAILAARGQVQRLLPLGQFAGKDRPGMPIVPGDRVAAPVLFHWLDAATGQWAARSVAPPPEQLVRLYLNVAATHVGQAIGPLARWLVQDGIPFSLKCPATSRGFSRADALVLYFDQSGWTAIEDRAMACIAQFAAVLRRGQPSLTRELAPGVGFAEDPGDGQSFGQHRCRLLAPVVAGEWTDLQDLVAKLRAALQNAGVDAGRPWRRAT